MATQHPVQDFRSNTVTFTAQRYPKCLVQYKVHSSPDIVRQARHQAIRSVAKTVTVPGFRKGRAPDRLIVERFHGPVERELEQTLASLTFAECQKLSPFPLLNQEASVNCSIVKQSLEEGAELLYQFETEPEVPFINPEAIELTEVPLKVIDTQEIETTLQMFQDFFATFEAIPDRGVCAQDHVVIDIEDLESQPPVKIFQGTHFTVAEDKMARWLYELLLGMHPGEAREGVSVVDEKASEEDKATFSAKKVRVTLLRIEHVTLPPIDDTFANQLGMENVAELRKTLIEALQYQAAENQRARYREQINEQLLSNYHFELPETLLKEEVRYRLQQLFESPEFLKLQGEEGELERKKQIGETQTMAERALRLFYLSLRLVRENKITVSPSELGQTAKGPLDILLNPHSEQYTPQEASPERQALALSRLALRKVEDFLISRAKVQRPQPQIEEGEKGEIREAAVEEKMAPPPLSDATQDPPTTLRKELEQGAEEEERKKTPGGKKRKKSS